MSGVGTDRVIEWFGSLDRTPFPFQFEVWERFAKGESGLIHSATGSGKTLAGFLGPVLQWLDRNPGHASPVAPVKRSETEPLTVLWITPLRALSADSLDSLMFPIEGLGLPWSAELRTGDSTSSERTKQRDRLPTVLVTTPESLTGLLAAGDSKRWQSLKLIVVDEWHELLGSKRGVQTELALARLRAWVPDVSTWGISATLGNLDVALETLMGCGRAGTVVSGVQEKQVVIDSLLPETVEKFPWAGHFGTQMIPRVIEAIEESQSCLVFTNTRAMSEIWYQEILSLRPDWVGTVGLHHGSLDRGERDSVEKGLKDGSLRAVVCTSSLDLGVDFSPVDRVVQLGSPKGVARLLQRAGRSGHRPGESSRVTCVPTHALEMVDIASARAAALAGKIEGREPVTGSLDVLAQHVVTTALSGEYTPSELLAEVRSTSAFRQLQDDEWHWTLDFCMFGGQSLKAYEGFKRVEIEGGKLRVTDEHVAIRHRLSIGTITSDAAISIAWMSGGKLGTVEEGFVARLKPGDRFTFAGKALEFVRVKDMTAYVKKASRPDGLVPRWAGGRLPLSNELAHSIRRTLDDARNGVFEHPEMLRVAPLLEVQARISAIPAQDEVLAEVIVDDEGHHLFLFPIEGRLVHEGLAALLAYRLSQRSPQTFTVACNDYGLELLSDRPIDLTPLHDRSLFTNKNLVEDILESLNSTEMAKRQFREIARIAGLIFQGFPGMGKSSKQMQMSSGLLYDVFKRFEPSNRLLMQATQEVLDRQLEHSRLGKTLEALKTKSWVITEPPRPTPFSLPIMVDRLRETVSSESLADRVDRIVAEIRAQ